MKKLFKTNYKTIIFITLLGVFSNYLFNLLSLKFKPELVIASVFFFSIFADTQPSKMALILVGVILDTFNTDLFGISSICFLIANFVAYTNSDSLHHQRFNIVWTAFAGTLVLVFIVENLFYFTMIPDYAFNYINLLNKMATILCYPILHMFYSLNIKWFEIKHA